jgi:hypothetical protein
MSAVESKRSHHSKMRRTLWTEGDYFLYLAVAFCVDVVGDGNMKKLVARKNQAYVIIDRRRNQRSSLMTAAQRERGDSSRGGLAHTD